jgi:hypothetical protein
LVTHRAGWKKIPEQKAIPVKLDTIFGRAKAPVTDELELVARAIDFANGKTDITPALRSAAFQALLDRGVYPKHGENDDYEDAEYEHKIEALLSDPEVIASVEKDRENTRRVLEAAATDPAQLVDWINNYRAKTGDDLGVIRRPTLWVDDRGQLQVGWRLDIDSMSSPIRSALSYIAVLLLSDHRGCRSNLGLCRLPGCGRFFKVTRGKPGRPRTDYCTDAHMEQAHALGAAERQKRLRERKKAAAKKPRRRRPS